MTSGDWKLWRASHLSQPSNATWTRSLTSSPALVQRRLPGGAGQYRVLPRAGTANTSREAARWGHGQVQPWPAACAAPASRIMHLLHEAGSQGEARPPLTSLPGPALSSRLLAFPGGAQTRHRAAARQARPPIARRDFHFILRPHVRREGSPARNRDGFERPLGLQIADETRLGRARCMLHAALTISCRKNQMKISTENDTLKSRSSPYFYY